MCFSYIILYALSANVINYSPWKQQPFMSHAKKEGSKDPKADGNLEEGCKISPRDISGNMAFTSK